MPEPTTLAAVGIMALAEGVKFLYAEAGNALKAWRAKRDGAAVAAPAEPVKPPPVFAGEIAKSKPDLAAVEKVEQDLVAARRDVSDIIGDLEPVDPSNEELLARIDKLRCLMEGVLRYRITFQGEDRPASGPLIEGEVNIDEIRERVVGAEAGRVVSGTVKGSVTAKSNTAEVIGVKVGDVG